MQKQVTIDDATYELTTMTAGDGLDIQEKVDEDASLTDRQKAVRRTLMTVAASLGKTIEEVRALPWNHYLTLVDGALDVNGMKVAQGEQGEAQAGESPAA